MTFQVLVSEWVSQFASFLPVGYAFGAGMVSAVNPCGFFMLPVYMTLYLGAEESDFQDQSLLSRMLRAIWITLVVTAGFGLLFGLVGSFVAAGGYFLMNLVPWFALIIGIFLFGLGGWILLGKTISLPFASSLATRVGDPREISTTGFFLFGVAFAITSLGCTLPIFLAVVGSSVATGDVFTAGLQFIGYVLGTGFILQILIMGIALVKKGAVLNAIKKMVPYVHKISAIFLLTAGGYIIYYWLKSGLLFSQ